MTHQQQETYNKIVSLLNKYFDGKSEKHWQSLFLSGGCYWFANFLSLYISDSYLVINRMEEHCAIYVDGEIYDIRGKISKHNFQRANEKEIEFMKKNYVPKFQTNELERYLREHL